MRFYLILNFLIYKLMILFLCQPIKFITFASDAKKHGFFNKKVSILALFTQKSAIFYNFLHMTQKISKSIEIQGKSDLKKFKKYI